MISEAPYIPWLLVCYVQLQCTMKDTEYVKNYCKTELEPNSILPRAYHFIDGFWLIASQNTLAFTVVCPQKQKTTMIVNPPLGIIKLNMSCTARSSYLTVLPYYQNESKSNIQDKFIDNLKSYNGPNLQIWKPFVSTMPYFTKISQQYWKMPKRFPCST